MIRKLKLSELRPFHAFGTLQLTEPACNFFGAIIEGSCHSTCRVLVRVIDHTQIAALLWNFKQDEAYLLVTDGLLS